MKGSIVPDAGPRIDYAGDVKTKLTINEVEYALENGRVFLVTTAGGTVKVEQKAVAIREGRGPGATHAQLDQIAQDPAVRAFLGTQRATEPGQP